MLETADHRPYHHGNLRLAFLDAAELSLRENGAEQLSLRDLARGLGVSHAAPRRHFTDRQGLLDALASNGFDRLGEALRTSLAESGVDFPSRVRNAVTAFMFFATENSSLYELMNSGKHRPGARVVSRAAEEAYRPMFDLIVEGQQRGAVEAGNPERIGIVLFATVQGITTMINGGLIGKDLLEELTDSAVRQFLRGAHPDRAEPSTDPDSF